MAPGAVAPLAVAMTRLLDQIEPLARGAGYNVLLCNARNVTDERERIVVRIPGLTTWGSWTQGENYGVEFAVSF